MVKRVRAARHYQRDDDPALRLSRSAMRGVARELRHAFTNLGDMVPVGKVTDALRHGTHPQIFINWHHYREVLRGPFDKLGKLRAAGGALGARKINGAFAAKGRKVRYRKAYNPDEPRDEHGRWATGGAGMTPAGNPMPRMRDENLPGQPLANAYGAGANAYFSGRAESENPFQAGSQEHSEWRRGYRIGRKNDRFDATIRTRQASRGFAKATGDQFNFDSFSPDIQQEIRDAQDQLIAQLESDARDAVDTIIRDGVINSTDLGDVAANIKDMIGLTDTQAQAVLNYQNMLEQLDPTALQRQLRNTDYDAVFQDAVDSGADLSAEAIDNMVEDYIDNYLDYRAATIAQTESTRAANAGLHDAYSQAIERGALPDEAVTRQWQLADMPCPICESIPDNNPEGVGVNESFDSDDGPIDDPPVHPNCECSVEYVTDLTLVPDDSEAESEYEFQTQT